MHTNTPEPRKLAADKPATANRRNLIAHSSLHSNSKAIYKKQGKIIPTKPTGSLAFDGHADFLGVIQKRI
jgi:hypothetical protein